MARIQFHARAVAVDTQKKIQQKTMKILQRNVGWVK